MKISKSTFTGKSKEFGVIDAVINECIANPYSYEGHCQKLQIENENLRGLVSRLIETIYGESEHRLNKADKLAFILGYGYEVEE